MQKQKFSNKMYNKAIEKIRSDHNYLIQETIDKEDMRAIIEIADLTFKRALADSIIHDELKRSFRDNITGLKPKKIGDEYDYIMQIEVILHDVDDAADFLAGCKLFVKYSSEYSMCTCNETYTFKLNVDRIDEGVYSD